MRTVWRLLPTLLVMGLAPNAIAGSKTTSDEPQLNACGCYKNAAGICLCGKKAKCECPGECEPKGCAEKREKDYDREIQAETKRAQEVEKKQQEEAAEKKKREAEAPTEEIVSPEVVADGEAASDGSRGRRPESAQGKEGKDGKKGKKGGKTEKSRNRER